MSESVAQVREIVRLLEREGTLSRTSAPVLVPDIWKRVTPELLTLAAIHMAVVDELGGLPEDGSAGWLLTEALAHTDGLEEVEVADLEGLLQADVVRASRLVGPDGFTWDAAYRLLGGLVGARRLSSADLDDLLERAEAMCRQLLESDLLREPRVRRDEYGPWDVSEAWNPDIQRVALGSLRVPRIPGVERTVVDLRDRGGAEG
ncbi:hypothetical protein [Streptomyces sp. B5E4]|uniref:hypothetical protein n=1 Tax=Streptomyces sp. B5E4 TaxID=3153568 RepID=UPI00325D5B5C